MSRIQSEASATRSLAKATIALRTIEQTKPAPLNINPNIVFGYTSKLFNTGYQNTALGYQAGYTVGAGLRLQQPNNSISFHNQGKAVLIITNDGDVEWHGKPSEAADALKTTFQFAVEDMKGVTKAARRRYYYRACKNILNKAEQMEHQEFLDFLKKHVYNKERRVIVDALQGRT